jgi:DNA mismatch endonuclease (patch repair protein)
VPDNLSPQQRSLNMAAIRSRNTKPEKIVRSLLHSLGFRFRIHHKSLPGKPDIVLPKYQTVVFVHGCFWHQHPGCKRCTQPSSNTSYWVPKLAGNVSRDLLHIRELKKAGWKVIVIWECEVKNLDLLKRKFLQIRKKTD